MLRMKKKLLALFIAAVAALSVVAVPASPASADGFSTWDGGDGFTGIWKDTFRERSVTDVSGTIWVQVGIKYSTKKYGCGFLWKDVCVDFRDVKLFDNTVMGWDQGQALTGARVNGSLMAEQWSVGIGSASVSTKGSISLSPYIGSSVSGCKVSMYWSSIHIVSVEDWGMVCEVRFPTSIINGVLFGKVRKSIGTAYGASEINDYAWVSGAKATATINF